MNVSLRRVCFLLATLALAMEACRAPQRCQSQADTDATSRILDETLPNVNMEPDAEAMFDWLSEVTGVPITVEWEHVSFDRDRSFDVWPTGRTVRQYLPALLDDLSTPSDPAAYAVRDGSIIISSARRLIGNP